MVIHLIKIIYLARSMKCRYYYGMSKRGPDSILLTFVTDIVINNSCIDVRPSGRFVCE